MYAGRAAAVPSVQVKLWRSIVVPALEYGAAIWGPELTPTQRAKLDTAQSKFLRYVLRCGPELPNAFARGETGLRTVSNHCD